MLLLKIAASIELLDGNPLQEIVSQSPTEGLLLLVEHAGSDGEELEANVVVEDRVG